MAHFFQFDTDIDLTFVSATCVLAVHLNHRPSKIVLHTNIRNLTSGGGGKKKKYLDLVRRVVGDERFEVRQTRRPTHVFGQRLSSTFHATDVARIETLVREGGIVLDLDTFVVRPLYRFFGRDCTVGWPEGQFIGTQIVVAKPGSSFARLWLQTYRDYRPTAWYYNAAEAPTKQLLVRKPDLVHRVKEKFGVRNLAEELYGGGGVTSFDWGSYYAVHLLARHRRYLAEKDVEQSKIVEFDEVNVQNYTKAFGEMARSIWNHDSVKNEWRR